MVRQQEIAQVITEQATALTKSTNYILREAEQLVPMVENFVTIITGVRRCGKSVLLLQVLKNKWKDALYLNFEDIRLTSFETSDFIRLHKEIKLRKKKVLFFDEIQLVEKWEVFVHQLLNEKYRVFITGSNATLLSKEMGTHLTGRHLSMELFPFSYKEFLHLKKKRKSKNSLKEYLELGGFPEYAKSGFKPLLQSLIDDILFRDIVARYGVREVDALRALVVYLFTNVGKPVSANKLTNVFGVKSATTLLDFFAYFQNAYLVDFVPQFSFSPKAQIRNPKKVYAIDTGFINVASLSFSEDEGRKLENLVFLHLRRNEGQIFYFKENFECDFVVLKKQKVQKLVQVCANVTDENFDREMNGLTAAMAFFKCKEGWLVTFDQKDEFQVKEGCVKMVPTHEFIDE